VGYHVALSVVGADRLPDSGYHETLAASLSTSVDAATGRGLVEALTGAP